MRNGRRERKGLEGWKREGGKQEDTGVQKISEKKKERQKRLRECHSHQVEEK